MCCACADLTTPLEADPATFPPRQIIAVSASPTTISADGRTTSTISGSIAAGAGPVTVTFTTTAGVFVESGAKTVTALALPSTAAPTTRIAATALRSDTLAAAAVIRATVLQTYYDTITVRFTKP